LTETKNKPVILVDDSEQIRFALGELLRTAGYIVIAVSNGRTAINTLIDLGKNGKSPSAVVSDLIMDDVPGFDVIVEAKRQFPDCPIIAMSGGTPNVDPDLTLDLAKLRGAAICLRKPFSNEVFLSALANLTDSHGDRLAQSER
jgi:CheY-like chemotaxis protein